MQKEYYYFAYGSNLNRKDWNSDRSRPRFHKAFQKVTVGWLPGYDVGFTHYSASRDGGVLDIIASPRKCVPGVIYRVLSDAAWEALNLKEGVPFCYKPVCADALSDVGQPFSVIVYTQTTLKCSRFVELSLATRGDTSHAKHSAQPATVYQGCGHKKEGEVPFAEPNPEYVEIVRRGLIAHALPDAHILAAAKKEPTPPLIDTFFCYGTLRKGDCLYNIMESFGIISEQAGTVRGDLYDCGAFPGLILGGRYDNPVYGELVQVQNIAEALRRLDQIEGYNTECEANSLYRRVLWPVIGVDKKITMAWVYEFARKPNGTRIESGDWFSAKK